MAGFKGGTSNKGGNKKATPKKKRGGGHNKPFSDNSLEVVLRDVLSGPSHRPKMKYSDSSTSISMINYDGLSGPSHSPKDAGKPNVNSFKCFTSSNGNRELNDQGNKKYKVYTDTDSDGKTEIITDIKCKYNGKSFAVEVKVDPGPETNCKPLSHFRHMFPQHCKTDGLPKETALEPTLAVRGI